VLVSKDGDWWKVRIGGKEWLVEAKNVTAK
jgi:hypothetical protein